MGEGTNQKPRNRRYPLLLLLLSIAGIGCLLWLALKPSEPSFEGKSLRYWLSRSDSAPDEKNPEFLQCQKAFRAIGTNAIPPLLRILRAKDSPLKIRIMQLLDRQSYIQILPIHSVEEERDKAVAGFYLLGDLATNAVPALIEIASNKQYSYSHSLAEAILMELYPAKSLAVPYWLLATNRAEWYFDTGMVQVRRTKYANAILAFSQAIELAPTNVNYWVSRGDARYEIKDFTPANSDYEKAIQLSPANCEAIAGRGLCKLALKDFRSAEADFTTAMNLETNDFRWVNYRGTARVNLHDFTGAAADFDRAIEIAPYAGLYWCRADMELVQGEFESALADASKSIEQNDKDPVAWTVRGQAQMELKNYRAGVTNADQAIKLDPKDTFAFAYSIRALAHLGLNEFDQAAADLETFRKLNPTNALSALVQGFLRMKRGGEDDAALADFERAVKLDSNDLDAVGVLGLFQYQIRMWSPALAQCRKAMELGAVPHRSVYPLYIWLIRAQSGESEAANHELEIFLKKFEHSRTNEWIAITGRFLIGNIPEKDYFNLAITAARRPSAITNQIADAYFYAGMKRKIAGDKIVAVELLQKCVAVKEDNDFAYLNAQVELRELKEQMSNPQ